MSPLLAENPAGMWFRGQCAALLADACKVLDPVLEHMMEAVQARP
jgi:hypothetical protein